MSAKLKLHTARFAEQHHPSVTPRLHVIARSARCTPLFIDPLAIERGKFSLRRRRRSNEGSRLERAIRRLDGRWLASIGSRAHSASQEGGTAFSSRKFALSPRERAFLHGTGSNPSHPRGRSRRIHRSAGAVF